MPHLALNRKQKQFVEAVVSGISRIDAYRAAYPRCTTYKAASTGVARLALKPWVQEYLRGHREEVVRQATKQVVASRQEILEFLTAIIRTPAGEVDALSKLCQRWKHTPRVKQLRMPGKLKAIDRVCEMMGWRACDQEVDDPLLDLICEIRAGAGHGGRR